MTVFDTLMTSSGLPVLQAHLGESLIQWPGGLVSNATPVSGAQFIPDPGNSDHKDASTGEARISLATILVPATVSVAATDVWVRNGEIWSVLTIGPADSGTYRIRVQRVDDDRHGPALRGMRTRR